ncbi:Diuretic hormone receptor [Gryllus bimaculatus]|nr:Diuretic hormone receptor [Gryllus bimaculatus]
MSMCRVAGSCPPVWDGWGCWDEAASNSMALLSCPSHITRTSVETSCAGGGLARRFCGVNGTWARRSNYSGCATAPLAAQRRRTLELVAAYGVSMALLVPALAVLFLLYR